MNCLCKAQFKKLSQRIFDSDNGSSSFSIVDFLQINIIDKFDKLKFTEFLIHQKRSVANQRKTKKIIPFTHTSLI